eukprot:EC725759.1.p1 GENE.EC725759.1~~EC725759.1.p1  ORF type:complete len:200 (+),score=31.80 EC725759.1:44-643(+)
MADWESLTVDDFPTLEAAKTIPARSPPVNLSAPVSEPKMKILTRSEKSDDNATTATTAQDRKREQDIAERARQYQEIRAQIFAGKRTEEPAKQVPDRSTARPAQQRRQKKAILKSEAGDDNDPDFDRSSYHYTIPAGTVAPADSAYSVPARRSDAAVLPDEAADYVRDVPGKPVQPPSFQSRDEFPSLGSSKPPASRRR